MMKNLWLLSSVAFIVSSIMSILVNPDLKTAFATGFITVVASFGGVIAVNRQQRLSQRRILTDLERQIRQMQKWEREMLLYLQAIAAEYQRTESYINYRQQQLNQISLQTASQQKHKQILTLDIISLEERNRRLENEIHHLERFKEELDLAVRSLKAEKHQIESKFRNLKNEIQQTEAAIAEQKNQKEQLDVNIHFLRMKLEQWQTQILEVQTSNQEIQQFINLGTGKLLMPAHEPSADKDDTEWSELLAQLTPAELQVLKAIIEHENPNSTIKAIAEANITMPEILIAAINERAIETIGDIIIETGLESPAILDSEYLQILKKVFQIPS